MSGSPAIMCRNFTIAALESSIASSMLTSMICAPFCTCWRATSTAAAKSPARISLANAREPVTLARSPTLTNNESSSMVSGSRPAKRMGRDMVCRSCYWPMTATCQAPSPSKGAFKGRELRENRIDVIINRQLARWNVFYRVGDGADVCGGRAAAAADDVDEAIFGEVLDEPRRRFRHFVITGFTHGIGQARVGVARHEGVCHPCDLLDIRPHQRRAKRAVEAYRKRLGMSNRVPERFRRLPRERAPGSIGDGARDNDRQP